MNESALRNVVGDAEIMRGQYREIACGRRPAPHLRPGGPDLLHPPDRGLPLGVGGATRFTQPL
ncbi:hypothetical protein ACIODT_38100 [Streptomyces sp. NPDC088251]|uniref:hypothetical protein n=1 Tax=unclassified Streptomyces TaxID=2593676 RepID=UPI003823ED95